MDEYVYLLVGVDHDGSCVFFATKDKEKAEQQRDSCTEYEQNRPNYDQDDDAYVAAMEKFNHEHPAGEDAWFYSAFVVQETKLIQDFKMSILNENLLRQMMLDCADDPDNWHHKWECSADGIVWNDLYLLTQYRRKETFVINGFIIPYPCTMDDFPSLVLNNTIVYVVDLSSNLGYTIHIVEDWFDTPLS